ncbi:MAG: hypothetical protein COV02_02610 [Candidatus Terrybacteria bacterium CG10_big_fil_rev_8_21_14_0_10_41_10]|uniref:Uncharacterized protein n=1 Tax=Candidatus Terrybacteria bacterium CG10_big_fil_rev_8_21_14_0_10_41_10 TaxID=1975026 RepID=A0A2M8LA31_9BACT|nr:MAG: hypothetical protein COV02_02610 [Candidatus Terrybacteria bacterium CG10_big_fil_rev_8_21_14_0_10_41_10]
MPNNIKEYSIVTIMGIMKIKTLINLFLPNKISTNSTSGIITNINPIYNKIFISSFLNFNEK